MTGLLVGLLPPACGGATKYVVWASHPPFSMATTLTAGIYISQLTRFAVGNHLMCNRVILIQARHRRLR